VPGVRKGARTTERFRRAVMWACEIYACLKDVRTHFRCSGSFVYDNLYPLLERKQRERSYPWPKVIGIDEHYFKRSRQGFREFVSMVVDFKGRRLFEVVEGRQGVQLELALAHIPGRENVRWVATDLADPYKKFVRDFFPNAQVVADKFHVLRLLNPAINRRRKEITGDRRSLPVRRMLLRNGYRLDYKQRFLLRRWLDRYPELREVYFYKEALHRLYRTRGQDKAAGALTRLTDAMAASVLPEIKTLRRTLVRWRKEILAYFRHRITNARTEGYNNVAKVVKKRGYGYRSFKTYRLRLLQACS
jgi:transposase